MDVFGLLFGALCNLVQKSQDLVRSEAFQAPFAEILIESGEERFVSPNHMIFWKYVQGSGKLEGPVSGNYQDLGWA